MRKLIIVAILSLVVSFPACAILVDAVDDPASRAIAVSNPFMGFGAGWDNEGGIRYSGGSCTLIRNNPQDGAWVITAKHAIYRQSTGGVFNFLRYCFKPCYFDGFPKGTTTFLPDTTVAAIREKVFYHPTQDVALIKLEHTVRDATGSLIAPIEFYTGELLDNQVILIGGDGETGTPARGGTQGTGYRDGYNRCARGVFGFLSKTTPGEAVMRFSRTVPIPGIACNGDSGGCAAIEADGKILLVGVIDSVYGTGEDTRTVFEYLGYGDADYLSWINRVITENSEIQSAVGNWESYQ